MNSNNTNPYIVYLPQTENSFDIPEGQAVLTADLTELTQDNFKNIKTFATKLFSKLKPKGLSPIAVMFLQQNFDFSQHKGEDLISGTISTICSLSGTPLSLRLYNAKFVQNEPAFKAFIELLQNKYENRNDFPTFDSVIIYS